MSRKNRNRREVSTPTPSLTSLLSVPNPAPVTPLNPLTEILNEPAEDRRAYHPLGSSRPATYFSGGPSQITLKDRKNPDQFGHLRRFPSQTKAALSYAHPKSTPLCVKRKKRAEVLHAMRKTGAGVRRRKPKRNWLSEISCK